MWSLCRDTQSRKETMVDFYIHLNTEVREMMGPRLSSVLSYTLCPTSLPSCYPNQPKSASNSPRHVRQHLSQRWKFPKTWQWPHSSWSRFHGLMTLLSQTFLQVLIVHLSTHISNSGFYGECLITLWSSSWKSLECFCFSSWNSATPMMTYLA